MPPPSDISLLPDPIVNRINSWLSERNFSGYAELSKLLADMGYAICPSQISRHAKPIKRGILEARQKALDMAYMSEALGADERGKLIELAADIGISRSIEALSEIDPIENPKEFSEVARSVASLGKLALEQKKWDLISASELERKLKQVEDELSKKAATPQEIIAQIRQTVFGSSELTQQIIEVESNS
jgi:Protein of unknown function (DUF3486)